MNQKSSATAIKPLPKKETKMSETKMPEVKLSQAEIETMNKLPEGMRREFEESILKYKREHYVQGPSEAATKNREVFSASFNDGGTIVVRGLNNRFPLGIRPDSLSTLLQHADELKAVIVKANEYIAANPDKVKKHKNARKSKQIKIAKAVKTLNLN